MRLFRSIAKTLVPMAFVGLALGTPSPAYAQTSEDHEVEQISVEEVGPFRPTTRPELSATEAEIVERTNAFRKQHDRDPLESDEQLKQTAQDFADYMAQNDRYGHSADGRTPSERARAHDYHYCLVAENIAYRFHTTGFKTEELARKAVEGWRESPGHRRNMLRPHVTETGVAVAQSEKTGVFYLVQLFGRPRSATIPFTVSNPTDAAVQYSLGDRSYELPPGFTRKHEMCAPAELQLDDGGNDSTAQTPSAGQRFVVTGGDDDLALEPQHDGPATANSRGEEQPQ
ncbi:MAG: CAP domain-containing protein [Planctomycetota bacterium]|nr:MAG: CAP domain-containing protein [Planctomycetota bacterium]